MSASAKITLALLPPSSRVHRFTWSAQPLMIDLPTSVEPVKQILRTLGWLTKRSPTTDPRPGMTVKTPSASPASRPSSASRIAVSGVSSAGLSTTVLPGRQGRREAPARDRHREVPGHDHPDHAERLAEGDVDPARHRDLPAEQPLRGGGVVVQDVADVAGLPAGVADGVAGVAHLELGQLLDVIIHQTRRTGAAAGPAPPGRSSRQAGKARSAALDRASVSGRGRPARPRRPVARSPG